MPHLPSLKHTLYITLTMILYKNMTPIEHVVLHPICVLSHLMCACKHCIVKKEKDCLWKEILSQQRIRHQGLTEQAYIIRLPIRHHQLLLKWNLCRVARWPVFHRPGRYFTANLAVAGKKPVFKKTVPEASIWKIKILQ